MIQSLSRLSSGNYSQRQEGHLANNLAKLKPAMYTRLVKAACNASLLLPLTRYTRVYAHGIPSFAFTRVILDAPAGKYEVRYVHEHVCMNSRFCKA